MAKKNPKKIARYKDDVMPEFACPIDVAAHTARKPELNI